MMRDAGDKEAGAFWAKAGRRHDHDHMVSTMAERLEWLRRRDEPSLNFSFHALHTCDQRILLIFFGAVGDAN